MKKHLFFLGLFILISGSILAQDINDEITLIQAEFGMGKRQLVEAYMDLPGSSASTFWKVYQEYEADRQLLARERIVIINDYLENLDSMGEDEADDLAKRSLKNDVALSKLHQSYFKKFKKATSAKDAAKFLQIDIYIHNTIRNQMQQELPFIEEN
ncbi:hypothetical protein [Algoriphagus zhangzhouensis]|uniref:Uncharacterized protein n=1 Tax=Algoriphagus zhangzhouensis TaxID=1073327 RepID=A0A1M7ZHR0_9BACT|nr:hypothetical protein [Algoriphagus zhangzhouensis]TDY44193.1 hypothetical protein A8938_3405 [Algoriphagus zhangzhouensis]SHO64362.1 hypothetical protein SAMN04488108_3401 [Algoriphagus zhangzhouensis]